MEFNRELFIDLCKRYQVPFSSTSGKCQIIRGEGVVNIDLREIQQIICSLGMSSHYDISLNGFSIQDLSVQYSLEREFLPAC